jgi:hypothetical protein
VPVNADVLDVQAIFVEKNDHKANPIGVKGLDGIGILGAAAAIVGTERTARGCLPNGEATMTGDEAKRAQTSGSDQTSTGQPATETASDKAPGDRQPGENLKERQDKLLDEAVEETFPASDPISPKRITK